MKINPPSPKQIPNTGNPQLDARLLALHHLADSRWLLGEARCLNKETEDLFQKLRFAIIWPDPYLAKPLLGGHPSQLNKYEASW